MSKPRLSQFEEGSLVHIIHRGTRGSAIVLDISDKWHFLAALYFLNDKATDQHWQDNLDLKLVRSDLTSFEDIRRNLKKKGLGDRMTYVDILAYCLMPNHFHILIRVKKPEDVGKFMQRLSTSLAMHFNIKYKMKGSLFESRYKTFVINTNLHLDLILPYIIYKNPCEIYRGGIKYALKNHDEAFKFASNYPFCSLGDLLEDRPQSSILNKNELHSSFEIPNSNKKIKIWCENYLKNRPDQESNTDYILE